MAAYLDGNELILSGVVGGDAFLEDGFGAADVIGALASVGRNSDITVRLNSPGGIATEGAAIHAALASHKGNVHVIVEGIAASAASLLAMAGDRITMTPGSVMMIHDPAGMTFGDAAAHAKTIEGLNALGDAYAGIYSDRSGKTVKQARAIMKVETWFTGSEAVDAGFADDMGAANDDVPEPAAFAYQMYSRAPERLVALAHSRGWKARATMAAPVAPTRHKETVTMTDETPAGNAPETEVEAVVESVAETVTEIEAVAVESAEVDAQAEEVAVETVAEVEAAPVDPVADPVAEAFALASEIAVMCSNAGVGILTAQLIEARATPEQAKARIAEAREIRDAVAHAKRIDPKMKVDGKADAFILRGQSVNDVRAALLIEIAETQSPEVSPHVAVDAKSAVTVALDKAVDRINARNTKG